MRKFTIRSGKYAGQHTIYDTVEEAKQYDIIPISPWYEAEEGQWAVSDDGYVLQVLKRYTLRNKRHKSGQYTDTFRFVNGTFWVYHGKKRPRIKNFYGALAANSKSSLGNTPKIGRFLTVKKKYFVELLASGLDPYRAYMKAFKVLSGTTRGAILYNINKLLEDEAVLSELQSRMRPMLEQAEKIIKEKTGKPLEQVMAEKLAELIISDDRNSNTREFRSNFMLATQIFSSRLNLALKAPTKKELQEIKEAEYSVMAPPILKSQGDTDASHHIIYSGNYPGYSSSILFSMETRKA